MFDDVSDDRQQNEFQLTKLRWISEFEGSIIFIVLRKLIPYLLPV